MGPGGGVKVEGWLDKRGAGKRAGGGKEGEKEESETTWIHCSVGLEEEEEVAVEGGDGEQEEGAGQVSNTLLAFFVFGSCLFREERREEESS